MAVERALRQRRLQVENRNLREQLQTTFRFESLLGRSPAMAQVFELVRKAARLFGHEKGAFTGAVRTKSGLMEMADRGTLFLDEIGEMPLGLQSKLLRALQERQIRRVGGTALVDVDVRLVSATNRDLRASAAKGEFRDDLFYRINVIAIRGACAASTRTCWPRSSSIAGPATFASCRT